MADDDKPDKPPEQMAPQQPVLQTPQGVPGVPAAPAPAPAAAPPAPAPELNYSQEDINRLVAERRANTRDEVDFISKMNQRRMDILNNPPPHPALPQYRNIPEAPKMEPRALKDAMPGLIFATVMGSMMSRRHGMDAMNAASGYMEGWQKGDKDRMNLQQTNWKNAIEATIKQNEIENDRYQAVWNDRNMTVADRQAALLGIASSINDHVMIAAAKNGDIDLEYKFMTDREKATLDLKKNQFMYGDQSPGLINDQALDAMVGQYLAGDRQAIANLGRGAQGPHNLANFRNRLAAEMERRGMSGADVAQKMAAFEGQKAEMRLLANREVNLGMASRALITFAGPALAASERVPRGQWVPINRLNQNIGLMQSNPDLREFSNRNQGLISEYAQIISRTGVSTVHAQQAAEGLLNTAESQEAYQRAVDVLIQEAQMAESVPAMLRREVEARVTGRPVPAAPAPAPVPTARSTAGGARIRYDAEGNRIQ
jgi:pyruvoyl-dependent arginine decarboxylase (PvlArgDC)